MQSEQLQFDLLVTVTVTVTHLFSEHHVAL